MFKFLRKKIFEIQPAAFGLDISDLTVKLVKLKLENNDIKLASFGKIIMPPGIIKEGKIQNEPELIKIITQLFNDLQGEKIKNKYVIASLPEQESFVRVVQTARVKEEDLPLAVQSAIEANIPMKINDLYFDWKIISSLEKETVEHWDIFINAIPKTIVDAYVGIFKKINFNLEVLEVESAAVARALVRDDFSEKPILIIDFGANRTIFIIFAGNTVRFTSSSSVSGHLLTKTLAAALNINQSEAERVKREKGIDKFLEPVLNDLINEIQQYLEFYVTHAHERGLKYNEIQKIILSGGSANLLGLPDYLAAKLNMTVELGNPWINILKFPIKEVPEMSYGKSLEFTTALGLALRGLHL